MDVEILVDGEARAVAAKAPGGAKKKAAPKKKAAKKPAKKAKAGPAAGRKPAPPAGVPSMLGGATAGRGMDDGEE